MMPSLRHVPWHVIEQRLTAIMPIRDRIPGDPLTTIDVEDDCTLALCVFAPATNGERLPLFINLECERRGQGLESHVRFACRVQAYLPEFYNVIRRTADRVQLDGMRVDDAIRRASDEISAMLSTAALLPMEQQVGLWGELFVLSVLAKNRSWRLALSAWSHGQGAPEEHDFSLPEFDLEVKTTRMERRIHTFGSTQLAALPGRPLFVCSLQLTAAGAAEGDSLASFVSSLRTQIPSGDLDLFERGLLHAGWNEARASQYSDARWLLRSEPAFVSSDRLPRLEPAGAAKERIAGFSFEISFDGLESERNDYWLR